MLIKTMKALIFYVFFLQSLSVGAAVSNANSTSDLEYGVVLFDFFQKNYFTALIEQEYAQAINNPEAKSPNGQVLKGGMMLSYGMADEAKAVFDDLLSRSAPEEVKNRAWYYLAKVFYAKSDTENARQAISKIQGKVPQDINTDYHYLATLLNHRASGKNGGEANLNSLPKETPYYPYLLFNFAILQLQDGKLESAVNNLEKVTEYASVSEEMLVLSDRARHGLAELAVRHGQLPQAWNYLKSIRTTGVYSNRALLSYAWAAINLKQFNDAIPALEMLVTRSIAIPEVQEAKVLLGYVYEREGSPRKALKSNLIAEKEYGVGITMVNEARKVLKSQDVPREFVTNLEVMMDETDWYSSQPTVDYKKLTPFVIDLMASHPFRETLRELADLYAIEENLNYWSIQANEHSLILANADKKTFDNSVTELVQRSVQLKDDFIEQDTEYRLTALVLPEKDQERMKALFDTTSKEIELLDGKVEKLKTYKKPYQQPSFYKPMVADKHAEIKKRLIDAQRYIGDFETIMRNLVNGELNKHEERMRYYAAQAKLSKARLYDLELLSLEKARATGVEQNEEGKNSAPSDKKTKVKKENERK
jgi:outer membrane protein assembly factor BamD (BamD/ComL family)